MELLLFRLVFFLWPTQGSRLVGGRAGARAAVTGGRGAGGAGGGGGGERLVLHT